MQVGDFPARKPLKLLDAADTNNLGVVLTDPQRDWCAPETVAAHAPVTCVCNPVAETLLLNESWHPLSLFDAAQNVLAVVLHLDEPAADSAINQRRVTTPAERIRVHQSPCMYEPTKLLQHALDFGIRVLNVHAAHALKVGLEVATLVDQLRQRSTDNAVALANSHILLTEVWCGVHDTTTGVSSDHLVAHDHVGARQLLLAEAGLGGVEVE
ncbi:hypothetical protein STCU 05273, putative [Babesia ovata]|uniref:Uncharacterized protein n=1 Tax=Babesia ovata TaxID=189622 RepID=A0A2H6K7H4_9APIC|nr:hypothetical protein STCU 05273, putative [Babesia ovata]GBE58928.1 hypothetical protein STCU 05273, putative [Babesia ovata]